jgi:glucose-6-phosphate isomerase
MSAFISPIIKANQGFSLDVKKSGVTPDNIKGLQSIFSAAHSEMGRIEGGEIKNPDEGRKVTHFTDRIDYPKSSLCGNVESFFADLRAGAIAGASGKPFRSVVVNGIGGSALGPQFVHFALNGPYWNEQSDDARNGNCRIYFTDNTDPSGIQDIMAVIDPNETLVISISKSGGTRETKNNMTAFETLFTEAGLDFSKHAAAITMEGSKLDAYAIENSWLKIWPMEDSIGGRTSETAIVGHVPAAAAGIDFRGMLEGACLMDEWTRDPDISSNPAYLLAALWYLLGQGKGDRNMVIVPYSDRLVLLSKYLQQLVMESLGKERDLDGKTVHQGLTVFGNKGGTDAHAYIQQLNDGRNDFFITFIEVLKDPANLKVDGDLAMGDFLHNFKQGLTNALADNDRSVINITIEELNAESVGMLIALYERAVAVYAELINVNAFHQPGVEAYKKLSNDVNDLSLKLQKFIADNGGFSGTAEDFASKVTGESGDVEGIIAKFCLNGRSFSGNSLTRSLTDGTFVYTVG